MPIYKYISNSDTKNYNQIIQSKSMKYSLVRIKEDTAKELWYPFKCKDYFNEVIASHKHGQGFAIYAFSYSFKKNPFEVSKTQLGLTIPVAEEAKNLKENFHYLNEIEVKNGLQKSELSETDNKEKFVVIADPYWQTELHAMSTYTWLLRLLSYMPFKSEDWIEEFIKNITFGNDQGMLKGNRLREQFKVYLSDIKNYKFCAEYQRRMELFSKNELSTDCLHNYSGICSALSSYQPQPY